MGRTIHGKRTKGGSTAKITNNCCIFGIMGGTAPLIGVPMAHRSYQQNHARTKALCIKNCALGHKYLKDNEILGCNPQSGGVGNMWRHRHYSHRHGPTPEGDGSAHGSGTSPSSPCCNPSPLLLTWNIYSDCWNNTSLTCQLPYPLYFNASTTIKAKFTKITGRVLGVGWHGETMLTLSCDKESCHLYYNFLERAGVEGKVYDISIKDNKGNVYKLTRQDGADTKKDDLFCPPGEKIYFNLSKNDTGVVVDTGLFACCPVPICDKNDLQIALKLWFTNNPIAVDTYGDISVWDVSNVTDMSYLFHELSESKIFDFNEDISSWDVSKVTNMHGMFHNCTSFNQDLSNWKVGNVTDMRSMFSVAADFNGDLSLWDVSKVTNMSNMFSGATSFNNNNASLAWDSKVGNVTEMRAMFYSATSFNQDLRSWDVSKVTDHSDFDTGATAWILPRPHFNNP